MMYRRLGFAAAFMLAIACTGYVPDAAAQTRRPSVSREAPQTEIPQAKQEKNFPLGATWSAVSLNGKPIGDRRATLQVDMNLRGTGFAGCNTFSAAAYPLRQQGFAVGPVALTKRTCDKGMADFERSYLLALRGVNNWDLVGGSLVLKGAAGELRFDRGI